MSVEPIDLKALAAIFHIWQLRGVHYLMGAKAVNSAGLPDLTVLPTEIQRIDCSGATRYAVRNATKGHLVIPEGSAQQHEWAESNLKKASDYRMVLDVGHPGKLWLAFIVPTKQHSGHVWFVHDHWTMESHGGAGVQSRPWDARPLLQEVVATYEWPTL